jgi:uncharacterized protein YfaS (alpha-2-macroglobulin family)
MRLGFLHRSAFSFLFAGLTVSALADSKPRFLKGDVASFSPEGDAREVRQVLARFKKQMLPFGDPRGGREQPFKVDCAPGTARWLDGKTWAYDFDSQLPTGVRCRFTPTHDKEGNAFAFDTGGPRMNGLHPGWSALEDQAFFVYLTSAADVKSVEEKAYFIVSGQKDPVGVMVVTGSDREKLLTYAKEKQGRSEKPEQLLMLRPRQNFPAGAEVRFVWAKGIRSPDGLENSSDQDESFEVMPPFRVTLSCERVQAGEACLPISPLRLQLSTEAPARDFIAAFALKGPDGKLLKPKFERNEEDEDSEEMLISLSFAPPFRENADYEVVMRGGLKDSFGRKLENTASFPLKVKTSEAPPLAKFAAGFGVIESSQPLLPLSVRSLHDKKEAADGRKGLTAQVLSLSKPEARQITEWLYRGSREQWADDRAKSVFVEQDGAKDLALPKEALESPLSVIGIPLAKTGLHVVEVTSPRLGQALIANKQPMRVATVALTTNLGVHFKWARRRSLVWVTSLDEGKPVSGADVSVHDCSGKELAKARSDAKGRAVIEGDLPEPDSWTSCGQDGKGDALLVMARKGSDTSFTMSSWTDGIESWRFNMNRAYSGQTETGHSVLGRNLVRPGETVPMKHFVRRADVAGLGEPEQLPKSVWIDFDAGADRFGFPLTWQKGADGTHVAETVWNVPKAAKLGSYSVVLSPEAYSKEKEQASKKEPEEGQEDEGYGEGYDGEDDSIDGLRSASIEVQEFRVPLMRAEIQGPQGKSISGSDLPLDLSARYLSGGGAGGLPVVLRTRWSAGGTPSFEAFEGFAFSTPPLKERTQRSSEDAEDPVRKVEALPLVLGPGGALRESISPPSKMDQVHTLEAEMEFRDPSGETQSVSKRILVFPASVLAGIKADSWVSGKGRLRFRMAAVGLDGKPRKGVKLVATAFQNRSSSHRKRLVGGFYAWEHMSETKKLGEVCSGTSDSKGLFICDVESPTHGNIGVMTEAKDDEGRVSYANASMWVARKSAPMWFGSEDNDRMDVLPEEPGYEPGQTARFQVRVPFRRSTALVTVEREGVLESYIQELDSSEPVVELKIKPEWAPNVYVSVLAVRGRVNDAQPTGLLDLGRPAFKLGIGRIKVGWKRHELKVSVSPAKEVFRVREKAPVEVRVSAADGSAMRGGEVALMAVDEGLLELMPNDTWKILEAFMGERGLGVHTSTAQMQVIGRRHYGKKAAPAGGGGGGGRGSTRELFDTLVLWQARLPLDGNGRAKAEIPLNDSLTGFRVVAVAHAGQRFGNGSASIRTSQDLMLLSALPPVLREGDHFLAEYTVRNGSDRRFEARVRLKHGGQDEGEKKVSLKPGEAATLAWPLKVPALPDGVEGKAVLEAEASADGGASDRIKNELIVRTQVPVRVLQSQLVRLDKASFETDVERPEGALPGRGSLQATLSPTLVASLEPVRAWMKAYPYDCLEQRSSRAIALRDRAAWKKIMEDLPSYLDGNGLAKYFPEMREGSEVLTAYVLSVAHASRWEVDESSRERMIEALKAFVEAKVPPRSAIDFGDLLLRKLLALEALTRYGYAAGPQLSALGVVPQDLPTSALLDWHNVLGRTKDYPQRAALLKRADELLKARLVFQGNLAALSGPGGEDAWWLMRSTEETLVRLLETVSSEAVWKDDVPRLMKGTLERRKKGHWGMTTANAWGVLAVEAYARNFEKTPVTGQAELKLGAETKTHSWTKPGDETLRFGWPASKTKFSARQQGSGAPYLVLSSHAALPLKAPLEAGYRVSKKIEAVQRARKDAWTQGDLIRVTLKVTATADRTWVVVDDPVPTGASILGGGLLRDSRLALDDGKPAEKDDKPWWSLALPAFEERRYDAYRAFYEWMPEGEHTLTYTMRLNASGDFGLPTTRVEALYAPGMFAERPNEAWKISEAK